MLLASGLALALPGRGRFWIVGGLLLFIFFSLTLQRNRVWVDEYSLWSDTLKKAPDNGRAHYGMGTAYDSKGMLDEAIGEYGKAIRTGFYSPNVLNALALAYYKKGSGGEAYDERLIDGAIRLYRKALEIEKTHRDARYNLAILYQERGMADEAIKEYNELLRYEPDDFDAHNSLGYAYLQKGLFKEALVHYRKAMAIDSESVAPYNNIGMVYAISGETGEAEKWFRKGQEIDPDSAEAYYNLGFLYQNMGRSVEAADNYKKALRMRPDYKEARARLSELEKQ